MIQKSKGNTVFLCVLLALYFCNVALQLYFTVFSDIKKINPSLNVLFHVLTVVLGSAYLTYLYLTIRYRQMRLTVYFNEDRTFEDISAIIERCGFLPEETSGSEILFMPRRLSFLRGKVHAEVHDFCMVLRGPRTVLGRISQKRVSGGSGLYKRQA